MGWDLIRALNITMNQIKLIVSQSILHWKERRFCLAKGQMRHLSKQLSFTESKSKTFFKADNCFSDRCPILTCQTEEVCLETQTISDLSFCKSCLDEASNKYSPCNWLAFPIILEENLSLRRQELLAKIILLGNCVVSELMETKLKLKDGT